MKNIVLLFLLFSTGLSAARVPELIPCRKGGLWGYCDSTKRMIIPAVYELAYPFYKGTAAVRISTKFGLIDTTGTLVVPAIYYDMDDEAHDGKRIVYKKKELCGLIDEKGNVLIPFMARFINVESDKYLSVVSGDKQAVYDWNGRIILPFSYVGWDSGVGGGDWQYRTTCVDSGLFVLTPYRTDTFIVVDTSGKQLFYGKYKWISYQLGIFECETEEGYEYYDCRGNHLEHYLFEFHPKPPRPEQAQNLVADGMLVRRFLVLPRPGTVDAVTFLGYADLNGVVYYEEE